MKRTPFFDLLNRKRDFEAFIAEGQADIDYIDWNGYVVPHDFGDAEQEYHAIRNECALFDDSPLRKLRISGDDAGHLLDHTLTRAVSHTPIMRALYVIWCNDDGLLKDDGMLLKLSEGDYLLMPSDIDHSGWFRDRAMQLGLRDVVISDVTDESIGVAMQGPLSARAMWELGFDGIEQMAPQELRYLSLHGVDVLVGRMGFTGDLGYECWLAPEKRDGLIAAIGDVRERLGLGIPGYGLGALEACRLEAGFIVAGWDFATELDDAPGFDRTPFEVGLGWAVDLEGADFPGKQALQGLRRNSRRVLRRFSTPAAGLPERLTLLDPERDVEVGTVNCAAWSWGLEQTVGTASVTTDFAGLQQARAILGSNPVTVTLRRKPLVRLERNRQVPAPLSMPQA